MTTARDLLTRAFRVARIVGEDATPGASMLNDAFSDLNELIDTWSNERLFVYDIALVGPFATVAGTASYTVATSATWNTPRPLQIESAFIRISGVDYGITFKPPEWYEGLPNKAVQDLPNYAYYETAYPSAKIWLYPTPDAAYSVYLSKQTLVSTLATLDTSFSVPPGYLRALRLTMACELAPQYNTPISSDVKEQQRTAVAAIKRTNAPQSFSGYDDALIGRPVFNINTG